MNRKLVSEQPIENRKKSTFDVKYIDDKGEAQLASFWEKEEAEHFIIMFEQTTAKLKELKELFKDQYSEAKVINIAYDKKDVPTQDRTAAEDFHLITSGIARILTEKNKRYGNSALKPINVFNGKSKVGQRADDKLSRIQNSEELRKNDVCDLLGYLILICKENGWYDFTDQID